MKIHSNLLNNLHLFNKPFQGTEFDFTLRVFDTIFIEQSNTRENLKKSLSSF